MEIVWTKYGKRKNERLKWKSTMYYGGIMKRESSKIEITEEEGQCQVYGSS